MDELSKCFFSDMNKTMSNNVKMIIIRDNYNSFSTTESRLYNLITTTIDLIVTR